MITQELTEFKEAVQTDANWRAFVFFSANLRHLMPKLTFEKHADLFVQAARFAQRGDELSNSSEASFYDTTGMDVPDYNAPGIFASFHTGPYKWLGQWLVAQGKPLTIILSSDVAVRQGDRFGDWYRQLRTDDDNLEYLQAEDPMIFRKMIGALNRGRYLLLYVDGQTGARRQAGGKGSVPLNFLASSIWVRTGVAELARLAKVPVYPIYAYFDDEKKPSLQWLPTLRPPTKNCKRAEWAHSCMASLFHNLETEVCRRPAQWEGWLYIHHDLAKRSSRGQGGLLKYYMPFALHNRHFLLEKASLAAYPISGKLYSQIVQKSMHWPNFF